MRTQSGKKAARGSTTPVARASAAKKRRVRSKAAARKPAAAGVAVPSKVEPLSFRPRQPEDDSFILDLTEGQLGRVHQEAFGEPFPRQDFAQYLQSGAPTVVVVRGNRPIGYYSYLIGPDGKMHVSALVIDPAHQSSGVGTEVMKHLEDEARGQGIHTLEVFVQDMNEKSLAFTRKLGFVEVYRIPPRTICFQKLLRPLPGTATAIGSVVWNPAAWS
ncbi:MAG: GNAT family N-acetyltransferase [Alicyclobacillus sp.]|nr:GNAT family N-acetyltransferase [Alicyclobacillus sp.]